MKSVNPYLNFDGDAEEAFDFYRSVFGGEFAAVMRFSDFSDDAMGVSEADRDKIAHIALPLGPDDMLMASDVPASAPATFTPGNNVLITLEPESAEEAERLFEALSSGGRTVMPLQRTPWAEKHGSCADRFGIQWMIDYTGDVQFAAAGDG